MENKSLRVLIWTGLSAIAANVITAAVKERQFTCEPSVLFFSPTHSETEVTCQGGNQCSKLACASECGKRSDCVVFSYSSTTYSCILSKRPDGEDFSTTGMADWTTCYRLCPENLGYSLYQTSGQRTMCLRLVTEGLQQQLAKQLCLQDEANLVRVKTHDVYDLVRGILVEASFPLMQKAWVGAEDRQVEQQFFWNDGARLYQGTTMWLSAGEGYASNEDCLCISSAQLLHDCSCLYSLPFLCQYDV